MRLLEPQGKFRTTSRKPSRPYLRREKKRGLTLQVVSDTEAETNSNPEPEALIPGPSKPIARSLFTRSTRKRNNNISGNRPDNWPDNLTMADLPPPTIPQKSHEQQETTHGPDTALTPPMTPYGSPFDHEPHPEKPNLLLAALNLEASRLEIGLVALGILVLVAQMGALIWLGVRQRRRSAAWHQGQSQLAQGHHPHLLDASRDESNEASGSSSSGSGSSFSSTVGLLKSGPGFRPQSRSVRVGVPAFLLRSMKGQSGGGGGDGESFWTRLKARAGRLTGLMGSGKSKANKGRERHCLFDEVFPSASGSDCNMNVPGGTGTVASGVQAHHHGLVLGPPTVIPVISSTTTVSSAGGEEGGVGEFIENVRRKSSAILTERIMPPVKTQMEVLTEIGRRVSGGLQAGAELVLGRRRGNGNVFENEGYFAYKKDDGGYGHGQQSGVSYANGEPSDGHPLTPPEERYDKDLETGMIPAPFVPTAPGSAVGSSDNGIGRRDFAVATSSGANPRFSLMDFAPSTGAILPSGLVRRTNMHKRVSFAEGLISPQHQTPPSPQPAGGGRPESRQRRHSSFILRAERGAGAEDDYDEEMGGRQFSLDYQDRERAQLFV